MPIDIANIEKRCHERAIRFTPLRRAVMEQLLESDGPVGAYDLIPLLEKRLAKTISPISIYRSLDFLHSQGFITRIESLGSYIPASSNEDSHAAAYLVCDDCSTLLEVELPDVVSEVVEKAAKNGFEMGRQVVEFHGTCVECQKPDDKTKS